jgi:hypothetical protein
MMWFSTRRALGRALDEIEQLRRDVDGLRYDLEDAKERIQRLLWRSKRSTANDTAAAAVEGSPVTPSTNGGTAAASASAGLMAAVDPVSAKLLARRRRLPVKVPIIGCDDHVVFEDGRACPNCGRGLIEGG